MESESSSNSFDLTLEEGRAEIKMNDSSEANSALASNCCMYQNNGRNKEIEMVGSSEASCASAANSSMQQNAKMNNRKKNKDITLKWSKPTIVITFSALLALLTIPFILKNGTLLPQTIFRKPISFVMFVMVLMISFFCAANGVIFSERRPDISKVCNLISLTSVILSFTLLLCELLPSNFSLAPWIFFTFTLGALVYHCGLHGQRTPRTLKEENSS